MKKILSLSLLLPFLSYAQIANSKNEISKEIYKENETGITLKLIDSLSIEDNNEYDFWSLSYLKTEKVFLYFKKGNASKHITIFRKNNYSNESEIVVKQTELLQPKPTLSIFIQNDSIFLVDKIAGCATKEGCKINIFYLDEKNELILVKSMFWSYNYVFRVDGFKAHSNGLSLYSSENSGELLSLSDTSFSIRENGFIFNPNDIHDTNSVFTEKYKELTKKYFRIIPLKFEGIEYVLASSMDGNLEWLMLKDKDQNFKSVFEYKNLSNEKLYISYRNGVFLARDGKTIYVFSLVSRNIRK
jgi:hypothetical protein